MAKAIALVVIASSYYGIARSYRTSPYFAWVFSIVYTFVTIAGPIVIAGYARPNQRNENVFYIGAGLFALVYFAFAVGFTVFGGPVEYNLAVMYLFFFFVHVAYGRYGEEDGEPATFAKYLLPPAYILMGLGCAFMPSKPETNIYSLGFLYYVAVLVGLLILDRPIDRTKCITIAEDGTITKHVITNDCHYYAVSRQTNDW